MIQLEIHAFEKPKIVNQTELQYTKYKGDLVEEIVEIAVEKQGNTDLSSRANSVTKDFK